MTEKELKKLHKSYMIELMYSMRKELDRVNEENQQLKQMLASKTSNDDELLRLVRETAENVKKIRKK